MKEKAKNLRRGDIFYADLSPVKGSEQGGERPVIVIQNDTGNRFSPTTVVAVLTSKFKKAKLPTHVCVKLNDEDRGFSGASVVLLEQIRTVDKTRLSTHLGRLCKEDMENIDRALSISIGLCPAI
ncbi:MAG: type II toxin-antitoxin system PemK/MazF family toxin [Defluviitaleaceae bacterium]|nr:type II toxin-antitoxin system PemK/MazF family toxin [Defluviitaleaceae bacterium]